MSFENLGLNQSILKAIQKKGYSKPSPIQQKAIPHILKRKDILASAQTGTGKTAGFTLPILHLLSKEKHPGGKTVRTLVLTPTRELAAQVFENVKEYSEFLNLKSAVIFGGVNQNPQIRALKSGVDILIATPGRLMDLHQQKALSLHQVEILVLDEADRMLDMGFLKDIKKILALIPKKRQNLLFSATFSKEIKKLASDFMHQPILVEATPENTTVDQINQTAYAVDKKKKTDAIIDLIAGGKWQQVLVFTRTKHGANKLTQKMVKCDVSAMAIHGNKSQAARTKALAALKNNDIRVLVATDIAARGLDIPLLPHVINFELPNVPEDYVHRIGRTGRAGAQGEAISLVSQDEMTYLRDIEKLIGQKLTPKELEGFPATDKPGDFDEPARSASNQRRNSRPKSNNSRRKPFKRKPKS